MNDEIAEAFTSSFIILNSSFALSHLRHVTMRPRNHVDADDLADATGGFGTGVDRRADGRDVALERDRHEPAADLVLLNELHVRRLQRRIACLNGRYDALGFDQSD